MTRELSPDERRDAIDRRLEATLESARGDYLRPARAVVLERDDRWYGQLVALVANSIAETPDAPSTLRAATAMELFRGYCRLRTQLLGRIAVAGSGPDARDSDAALLAADYLHTAAYSTLGSLDRTDVAACIGTLASVSGTIIETVADTPLESTPSPAAFRSFVDGTAGALGRGAADIGATLAGGDDHRIQQFVTVGGGFSAARRVQRSLADDDRHSTGLPTDADRQRRRYARRRRSDATRTLRALSSTADVDSLRTFLEERTPADAALE